MSAPARPGPDLLPPRQRAVQALNNIVVTLSSLLSDCCLHNIFICTYVCVCIYIPGAINSS